MVTGMQPNIFSRHAGGEPRGAEVSRGDEDLLLTLGLAPSDATRHVRVRVEGQPVVPDRR